MLRHSGYCRCCGKLVLAFCFFIVLCSTFIVKVSSAATTGCSTFIVKVSSAATTGCSTFIVKISSVATTGCQFPFVEYRTRCGRDFVVRSDCSFTSALQTERTTGLPKD